MKQRIGRKQFRQYRTLKKVTLQLVVCSALFPVFELSDTETTLRHHTFCYMEDDHRTDYKQFDFRYFESLADQRKAPEAQAEINRLFLPKFKIRDHETSLALSKQNVLEPNITMELL